MLAENQIPFWGERLGFVYVSMIEGELANLQSGSSGGPARYFHGVGIGPLQKYWLLVNWYPGKCDVKIWLKTIFSSN